MNKIVNYQNTIRIIYSVFVSLYNYYFTLFQFDGILFYYEIRRTYWYLFFFLRCAILLTCKKLRLKLYTRRDVKLRDSNTPRSSKRLGIRSIGKTMISNGMIKKVGNFGVEYNDQICLLTDRHWKTRMQYTSYRSSPLGMVSNCLNRETREIMFDGHTQRVPRTIK